MSLRADNFLTFISGSSTFASEFSESRLAINIFLLSLFWCHCIRLLFCIDYIINQIINLFIHLIYIIYVYTDAEKPFLGMLNEVYVCIYV